MSASVATKPGPYVGAWTGSSQWRNRPRQPNCIARPQRIAAWEAHMKRILLGILFLAAFGMALAGPPVDYQLYCEVEGELGEGPIGVASLVEEQLHVALVDGALEACDVVDGFVTVAGYPQGVDPTDPDTEASFFLTFDEAYAFVPDVDPQFETTIDEVPQVAIEGKLGAMQNRAEAFQRAEEARARAKERAGGPPFDVPVGDDDLEGEEEEEDEEGDGMGVAGSRRR